MGGGGIGGMGGIGGSGGTIGGMGAMGGFGDTMESMGAMGGFGAPPRGMGGINPQSKSNRYGGEENSHDLPRPSGTPPRSPPAAPHEPSVASCLTVQPRPAPPTSCHAPRAADRLLPALFSGLAVARSASTCRISPDSVENGAQGMDLEGRRPKLGARREEGDLLPLHQGSLLPSEHGRWCFLCIEALSSRASMAGDGQMEMYFQICGLADDVSRLLIEMNKAWKIRPAVDHTLLPKGKAQANHRYYIQGPSLQWVHQHTMHQTFFVAGNMMGRKLNLTAHSFVS
ncbi:uncharacterized protein LOC123409442 [Hordeum vulgare subsp. vulgare]|uniref:uncharacterized protein LOC123409442 n=1 Tax=Hordeum vulgare subsp. vulgare TaxID=112509 RepID=UPI001D1A5AC7|nr:uncharacterized protein LOC123409442 [Hordeum vulgare subsp. vulgare]